MIEYQKTLKDKIIFSGVGLHTGAVTNMVLNPAKENHGISFERTDLNERSVIFASVHNVVETNRGTTIGIGEHKVYTVEHLLSGLSGLGIDNLSIEIDNIEPPIFDGSSREFVNKILSVGIIEYKSRKKYIKIVDKICYEDDNCKMEVLPSNEFKVSYFGNFKYGNIGSQNYVYSEFDNYIEDICDARTFCSIKELIYLKENNLIKGADLNSGIVFLDDTINENSIRDILSKLDIETSSIKNVNHTLNNVQLRFKDEPVRHKILDLIGDFTLLGYSMQGHIISHGGGHASNVELMKKIDSIYG